MFANFSLKSSRRMSVRLWHVPSRASSNARSTVVFSIRHWKQGTGKCNRTLLVRPSFPAVVRDDWSVRRFPAPAAVYRRLPNLVRPRCSVPSSSTRINAEQSWATVEGRRR